MRYLLLLLALVSASVAPAQTLPVAPQLDTVAAAPPATVPDTAAAIHRLFAAKRSRQELVVGGTVLAVFTTVVVVGAVNQQSPRSTQGGAGSLGSPLSPNDGTKGLAAVAAVILTPPLVLTEAVLFGGWGRKKEQQVIKAWQQHQLPAFYKRKLKPKYFQLH